MRAGIPKIPEEAADDIVKDSNGNMRKAILVLEALKMQTYVFLPSNRPFIATLTTYGLAWNSHDHLNLSVL